MDFGRKVKDGGAYVIETIHQDNLDRLAAATQMLYKSFVFIFSI